MVDQRTHQHILSGNLLKLHVETQGNGHRALVPQPGSGGSAWQCEAGGRAHRSSGCPNNSKTKLWPGALSGAQNISISVPAYSNALQCPDPRELGTGILRAGLTVGSTTITVALA